MEQRTSSIVLQHIQCEAIAQRPITDRQRFLEMEVGRTVWDALKAWTLHGIANFESSKIGSITFEKKEIKEQEVNISIHSSTYRLCTIALVITGRHFCQPHYPLSLVTWPPSLSRI